MQKSLKVQRPQKLRKQLRPVKLLHLRKPHQLQLLKLQLLLLQKPLHQLKQWSMQTDRLWYSISMLLSKTVSSTFLIPPLLSKTVKCSFLTQRLWRMRRVGTTSRMRESWPCLTRSSSKMAKFTLLNQQESYLFPLWTTSLRYLTHRIHRRWKMHSETSTHSLEPSPCPPSQSSRAPAKRLNLRRTRMGRQQARLPLQSLQQLQTQLWHRPRLSVRSQSF